jgi:predicted ATPase/class 3 adenylate cyclase
LVESPGTGTFTFLFTDIEGSTSRWEAARETMAAAVRRHDELTAAAVAAAGGDVVKSTGDGAHAVFSNAEAAAVAALDLRDRLEEEEWPSSVAPIRVRVGIHSGAAEARAGDYFGPTLNRTARLMDVGHGGQILISEASRRLIPDGAIELRFLGEYRLRDLLQPERIYQLGDQSEKFDPLRVLNERTHNLPVQVTSFVGRHRELAELADLIGAHRLITLTGPGGTGKTRLAVQVAAELTPQFHAVTFVPLAGISEPEGVLATIADALGLQDRSALSVSEVLRQHVSARPTLLVLDNFEHVMDAAPTIGRLIEDSEDLRVIVTSRELLRLRAERHVPVAPLGLPTPAGEVPVRALADSESVRLFEERARAARPGFRVDDANAVDVAAICTRLDGLPLAIELAAARVRLFVPAQLRSRLEVDDRALGTGPVDAPERHRTLVDTIAWSYELLEHDEQKLFRRLAVFTGGRSLEAVEAVCMDDLEVDAMAGIEALADKSLLRIGEDRTGRIRVHLLETIDSFAHGALQESGESTLLRSRHASYFARMAAGAEAELRGSGQSEWVARLEADRPNLEAALEWSFGAVNTTEGLQIVAGLRDFWFYQGHYHEMGRWVNEAMEAVAGAEPSLRAGVYMTAGFHSYLGYLPDAVELMDEAVALYERTGDPVRQSLAQIWAAGSREMLLQDVDAARRGIVTGLDLARSVDATPVVAQALNMLGELERTEGNYELAREIQIEGLELSRVTGEDRRVAMMTHNLGFIAHHLGDDDEAQRLLLESLDLSLEQRFIAQTAHSLFGLSEQIALRGNLERAAAVIGYADTLFALMGVRPQPADEPDHTRIRRYVEHEMGAAAYEHATGRGALLELDEAVALVRPD